MLTTLALAAPIVVAALGTGYVLRTLVARARRARAARNGGYRW